MTIPEAILVMKVEAGTDGLSDEARRAYRLAVTALEIVGSMCEQLSEDILRGIEE